MELIKQDLLTSEDIMPVRSYFSLKFSYWPLESSYNFVDNYSLVILISDLRHKLFPGNVQYETMKIYNYGCSHNS